MKYKPVKEGEWIRPIRRGYRMVCCDCGLVHIMNFRIDKRHILIQGFRDERATGQVRRWKK